MNPASLDSASPLPSLYERRRGTLIFVGKCVVGALLVGWLVRSGRLDFGLLAGVKAGWSLVGVFLCQAAMIACQAMRWHLLSRAQKLAFTPAQTILMSLRGQFAGVWTPSNLGMDGVRLLHATRLYPGRAQASLVALIIDRVVGVLMLLVLMFASLFFVEWRAEQQAMFTAARWIALSIIVAALIAAVVWKAWSRRSSLSDNFAGRIVMAMQAYHEQPKVLWGACGWALLTHICNALSFWFGFDALGIPAALPTVLMVMPAVILSFILPLTPLGLGVADVVAQVLFEAAGIAGGSAATMLLRATWLLLSLGCGLSFFYRDTLSAPDLSELEGNRSDSRKPGAMKSGANEGIGGNVIGRD